jgi:hypothetical protein
MGRTGRQRIIYMVVYTAVHFGTEVVNTPVDVIKALIKGLLALFKPGKPFDDFTVGYPGAFSTAAATTGTNKMAIKPAKIITLRIT